jgi:hypothetical protein
MSDRAQIRRRFYSLGTLRMRATKPTLPAPLRSLSPPARKFQKRIRVTQDAAAGATLPDRLEACCPAQASCRPRCKMSSMSSWAAMCRARCRSRRLQCTVHRRSTATRALTKRRHNYPARSPTLPGPAAPAMPALCSSRRWTTCPDRRFYWTYPCARSSRLTCSSTCCSPPSPSCQPMRPSALASTPATSCSVSGTS